MDIPHGVKSEVLPIPTHRDLYGGLPYEWTEIAEPYKLPSQRFQLADDMDCVAHSTATFLEAQTGIVASAQSIYRARKDYPADDGMYLSDAGSIALTGTTTETQVPSNNVGCPVLDKEALPPLVERYIKALGQPIYCAINIDEAAEAIQRAKAVLMTFESNGTEWELTPEYLGTPVTFGHCITGLIPTLINGVKTIIARDSAGQWSSPNGTRYITEAFLLKRCTGIMYWPKATADAPVLHPNLPQQINYPTVYDWHTALTRYFYKLFTGKEEQI